MTDPRAEYQRRLELHQGIVTERERQHIRLGNAKLFAIAAGLVVLWLAVGRHRISVIWVVLMVGVYLGLTIWHQRVIRGRTRAETAVSFYRRGLERIEDRWSGTGTGTAGERFRDDKHIYASDLDLFGRGSLFELLSIARLPMGEDRLAGWLKTPAEQKEIMQRQVLVAELRDKLDLREALAMTGEELRGAKLNPEVLIAWAEAKREMPGMVFRVIGALFVVVVLAALIRSFAVDSWWPFLGALLAQSLFYYWLRDRARRAVALDSDGEALKLFGEILHRLEQEEFSSPRLREAVGFVASENGAAREIRKLARLMGWMEAAQTRPMVVKLLDRLFAFTVHVGFAADAWRGRYGNHVRDGVNAVAEIEALLSLAGYSFEHPEDPFPQFVEIADDGVGELDGVEMGHPLLPATQCVRNGVQLGAEMRLLLISGSNMSGKSTLLRTVGVNVVLAMAGAPVRARSLRMTPLTLATHIRSGDSLQEGRSNFYTEILRLRQVFDLTGGKPPLLFLFDELLEGTNSHDRRIGAETLLHAFVERGGLGMVTTHDLVLTELVPTFAGGARNAHFEDSVEDGKMRFDYKLKEGVVTRSNALELMRLIGLKV